MKISTTLRLTMCLILIWAFSLVPNYAPVWNQKTEITISAPLRIPGKILAPGTYVFKLVDSSSNRSIVRIMNKEENRVYATILAIPNYRLEPTAETEIGLWEMPADSPLALRAWFFPGNNYGHEFPYPRKTARLIAEATQESVKSVADELEPRMAEESMPDKPAAGGIENSPSV